MALAAEEEEGEEKEAKRRNGRVCAASQAPHPPLPIPLLLVAATARRMVEEGQVVAVLPALEEGKVWLAKSEVRSPDTRTSPSVSP